MPPIGPNNPPPADDPGFELVADDPAVDRWNAPAAGRLPVARPARLAGWVRGVLVLTALGFAGVFGVALWLNPYDADGTPRRMSTHTQLGLPPCSAAELTGKPCPACGMTTSFALLAHGDVPNSLRANWVGTLLAGFWLALIPWAAVGAARGRYLFIRSGEALITAAVVVLLVLMLGRWAVIWLE